MKLLMDESMSLGENTTSSTFKEEGKDTRSSSKTSLTSKPMFTAFTF